MSSPPSRVSQTKDSSKAPIPRLNNHHVVDKPPASRECLNCRALKVSQCQRCVSIDQPCVYSTGRKDRLETVAEQNEHMITLMRHLKERVGGGDKQQIEDLLEAFGEPDGSDKHGEVDNSCYIPQLQDLQYNQMDHMQGTIPNIDDPSTAQFHSEVLSCQINSATSKQETDHFQMDSALLEMFWYLQTESREEAHKFLEYIRSSGPINVSSTHRWLRDRQRQSIARSGSPMQGASGTSMNKPTVRTLPDPVVGCPAERVGITEGTSDSTVYETSEAQRCSQYVTIATVKRAVDMFFKSTALLFHVVAKEQGESILHDALGEFKLPENTSFMTVLGNSSSLQAKARLAELCGMAAVGLLYLRISGEGAPPVGLGDYFYSIAKQMLDSSIEASPLRAMKVCALLAMYNIIVKARVALAYVELGLGLAETYGINDPGPSSTERGVYLDHKRTWRSLLTFSGWLAASIGYASGRVSPNLYLLEEEQDAKDEDIVQRELVKVTIIKSRIVRAIPNDGAVSDSVIDNFRKEIKTINERLPVWMTMGSLIGSQKTTPLRHIILYFHLFFLSAMQLLHRRAMANPTYFRSLPRGPNTKTAVREGLIAAKLAARILALMSQEGGIVQICWLCIYTSYTSGIIILQAAVQKVLSGRHPSSAWIADLTLANICVETLHFCAEVDSVAVQLKDIVQRYLDVIRLVQNVELNEDLGKNTDENEAVDYLFTIPPGDSTLHKAARDLLRLIHFPFDANLELAPGGSPQAPCLHSTLVNWMEAAVGTPQEWNWELQNCRPGMRRGGKAIRDEGAVLNTRGVVLSRLSPGRFIPMGNMAPWSTWTPHTE